MCLSCHITITDESALSSLLLQTCSMLVFTGI